MTKYTKLWDETKYLIKTINGGEAGEYEKDFMKTEFNSDNNLPLNKILQIHMLTVILRCGFQENGKYYSQVFQMNACMNYKC